MLGKPYEMVKGEPCGGLASHPGGSCNYPIVTLCKGNRESLLGRPLGSSTDLFLRHQEQYTSDLPGYVLYRRHVFMAPATPSNPSTKGCQSHLPGVDLYAKNTTFELKFYKHYPGTME